MVELSFEFFPPKTSNGLSSLIDIAKKYETFSPEYYSITFGAGASNQDKTLDTIKALADNTSVELMPHISCIYATQDSINSLLETYRRLGVKKLLVLRGDLPNHESLGEFKYAVDLLKHINQNFHDVFELEVAAYPEYHPQSENAKKDFHFFKEKIEAGASGAVTQYFYNFESFEHFYNACKENNIGVPITPGIMPIHDLQQLERFSNRCGADLPRWLSKELLAFGEDKVAMRAHGAQVVFSLCEKLLGLGVHAIHFYTLNKYEPAARVCDKLREK